MAYDPNTPNLSRDPSTPVVRRNRGGGGWAWVIVVIIIVVIIWLIAGSRGNRGRTMANAPANGTNASQTQNNGNAAQVTDASQLTSGDANKLVGETVQLASAKVTDTATSGAFLIDANGKSVLVVPSGATGANNPNELGGKNSSTSGANNNVQGENTPAAGTQTNRKGKTEPGANSAASNMPSAANVNKGDTVSIQGTLEKMPSEHEAITQFNLSSDEAARASKAKVYIAASDVQPASK